MSKGNRKVAKKYSRALFDSLQPEQLEEVQGALAELVSLWEDNTQFRSALLNPSISLSERVEVVREVGAHLLSGNSKLQDFLQLVLENGRIDSLPAISELFKDLLDAYKKQLSLKIVSAFPLSSPEQDELEEEIKKAHGPLVTVEWSTDPELLGGLKVFAGDKLLDSSIQGSLDRLRTELLV